MKRTPINKTPPIHVAIPNTTAEKMQAIVHCAAAVHELAKALNSVNVNVTVANCHIDATHGRKNGIQIGG